MRVDHGSRASAGATSIAGLGPWFHNLHLPDGRQTRPDHPYGDFPRFKWLELAPHLPARLDGWRALDIGCNAGFYSFELARRGAHVTGIDVDPRYLAQARWAADEMGLADRVELRQQQVYDLGRGGERWDLVLFMGVFYHLRYPLLGLDAVTRCAERLLVFQTMSLPGIDEDGAEDVALDERARLCEAGWPRMAFVERSVAGDRTNWWVPNHAGVEAMLRSTGMRVTARPLDETYLCVPDGEGAQGSFWSWGEDEYRAALGGGVSRPR